MVITKEIVSTCLIYAVTIHHQSECDIPDLRDLSPAVIWAGVYPHGLKFLVR